MSNCVKRGDQLGSGLAELTSTKEPLSPSVSTLDLFPDRTPGIFTPALVVFVSLALVLRGWNFYLLGLDHYDEGIYAFSGSWSLDSHPAQALYPFQKLFSPPGYWGLIGLVYRLMGGPSDTAAIGINVVSGAATVLLPVGRESDGLDRVADSRRRSL